MTTRCRLITFGRQSEGQLCVTKGLGGFWSTFSQFLPKSLRNKMLQMLIMLNTLLRLKHATLLCASTHHALSEPLGFCLEKFPDDSKLNAYRVVLFSHTFYRCTRTLTQIQLQTQLTPQTLDLPKHLRVY